MIWIIVLGSMTLILTIVGIIAFVKDWEGECVMVVSIAIFVGFVFLVAGGVALFNNSTYNEKTTIAQFEVIREAVEDTDTETLVTIGWYQKALEQNVWLAQQKIIIANPWISWFTSPEFVKLNPIKLSRSEE